MSDDVTDNNSWGTDAAHFTDCVKCVGLARTINIYTVYDRTFGGFPAKYIYGCGQPYKCTVGSNAQHQFLPRPRLHISQRLVRLHNSPQS
jgi:hypothetical protein